MKNFEKYHTADERAKAFVGFCNGEKSCDKCQLNNIAAKRLGCAYAWLDLDVEAEMPMPCPYCGCDVELTKTDDNFWYVECGACCSKSGVHADKVVAVGNYNRICRAVKACDNRIKVGDTIAYRTLDDNEPEWKTFTVRLIDGDMLYEHEDKTGDNINIGCAHKVFVKESEAK